jgi:hypothetical protein
MLPALVANTVPDASTMRTERAVGLRPHAGDEGVWRVAAWTLDIDPRRRAWKQGHVDSLADPRRTRCSRVNSTCSRSLGQWLLCPLQRSQENSNASSTRRLNTAHEKRNSQICRRLRATAPSHGPRAGRRRPDDGRYERTAFGTSCVQLSRQTRPASRRHRHRSRD